MVLLDVDSLEMLFHVCYFNLNHFIEFFWVVKSKIKCQKNIVELFILTWTGNVTNLEMVVAYVSQLGVVGAPVSITYIPLIRPSVAR